MFQVTMETYGETRLQSESAAYPNGGKTRKGLAVFPDGSLVSVRAGIADTYFTIPATATYRGRRFTGFLHMSDDDSGNLWFHPNR